MDFSMTKEHEFVRKMVREFAVGEVEPIAADIDKEHRFPAENIPKMARYGLLGVPFPKEYEGAGGDNLAYILTVEELSRVCATTGVICSICITTYALWKQVKDFYPITANLSASYWVFYIWTVISRRFI